MTTTEMGDEGHSEPGSSSVKRMRGRGRGGRFFVLDREQWHALGAVPTSNRLNLLTAFLVLLAGTGADHRLTKWSAKACEEKTGMGKPRAKHAIEELIQAGLLARTEASKPMAPQYRISEPVSAEEPIFLPMQLVTGLADEVPVLRRVRETGDYGALQMLIDLYGLVQLDATFGVPPRFLRQMEEAQEPARKIAEMGANAIWALSAEFRIHVSGDWCTKHLPKKRTGTDADWTAFWERFLSLQKMGAIWFEIWVFAGPAADSEPLFPISFSRDGQNRETDGLSFALWRVAEKLIGDRAYLFDQNEGRVLVTLPTHHQCPSLKGVARMRVEPDTPGRRQSYARRMDVIEKQTAAYSELFGALEEGRYDRPLRLG